MSAVKDHYKKKSEEIEEVYVLSYNTVYFDESVNI